MCMWKRAYLCQRSTKRIWWVLFGWVWDLYVHTYILIHTGRRMFSQLRCIRAWLACVAQTHKCVWLYEDCPNEFHSDFLFSAKLITRCCQMKCAIIVFLRTLIGFNIFLLGALNYKIQYTHNHIHSDWINLWLVCLLGHVCTYVCGSIAVARMATRINILRGIFWVNRRKRKKNKK